MSTISSLNNSNAYIPQATNKVAGESSTNPATNAANQSAFSSYISEALAQIGVANPTSITAPVVSGADETSSLEDQSLFGSFVKDLFSILSKNTSEQGSTVVDPTVVKQGQTNFQQISSQDNEGSEPLADNETTESSINNEAIAAYTGQNSTTVGTLAANLQSLIKKLNDESQNTDENNSSAIQSLKDSFQSVLDAQGAGENSPSTLGRFLQALAENLQGQSPLGIIINARA